MDKPQRYEIKVSVIVPIYNVQDYLQECLDTVYNQNGMDLEIILVNDGSTDDSLAICRKYAERHSNTIVIDKENGGLSDARNIGTDAATGEYIYYLDSDDWLAPDAIKSLFDFAVENQCEIVQGGFYYAYDDYLLYNAKYKKPFILERKKAMLELIKNDYVKNFAWGKLYRADIVKCHLFPKGKFYEDSYWQHLIINECNHYGIVPMPLYYYRQRESGISGEFSLKNMDLLRGYEERLKFIQIYYPEYIDEMIFSFYKVLNQFVECAMRSKNEEVKQAFTQYKQETVSKYGRLFDAALKYSLKYRIQHDFPIIYPIYHFVERVYNHFLSSDLKRKEI